MARKVERVNSWSYASGSRSLLRLMWFLDFVHSLLRNILAMPHSELRDSASKAYEDALAHHHPWILRKTIGAAMLMLPTKQVFLGAFNGNHSGSSSGGSGTGSAQAQAQNGADLVAGLADRITAFNAALNPVREELWRLYNERGLTDLP
jgi:hypothetical protein